MSPRLSLEQLTLESTENEIVTFLGASIEASGDKVDINCEYCLRLDPYSSTRTRDPHRVFALAPNSSEPVEPQIHCYLGELLRKGKPTGYIITYRLDEPSTYVMVDCLEFNGVWRFRDPELRRSEL